MIRNVLLDLYAQGLQAVEEAVAGVPESRAAEQPGGVTNHPAWTLAHLCAANDMALGLLGKKGSFPAEIGKRVGNGSIPTTNRADYPSIQESLRMLRGIHEAYAAAFRETTDEQLDAPAPEWLRAFAPTLGHVVIYFLTSHEQYHAAQLFAWKRAAGLM